jgi:hypothetical protein
MSREESKEVEPRQPNTRLKIANLCAVLKLYANLNEDEKVEAIQLKAEIDRLIKILD